MRNGKKKIGYGEPVGRFDQKNTGFNRARWDPVMEKDGKRYYGPHTFNNEPGNTLKDWAFLCGTWNLERRFAHATLAGDFGLTKRELPREEIEKIGRLSPGLKWKVSDPEKMSRDVKKVASFLGASLVGICRIDPKQVYSHTYHPITGEHAPFEIPEECEYAIVMAQEMDYELIKASPAYISLAPVGLGYSKMVFQAGLLAHFIRTLGYKAIPCGNDTALSIPMAIDAGLGELGRSGLLITKKFGSRVRISKVFTDLPLVPDKPIEFGVSAFCEICGQCAKNCPGNAINEGEPTDEGYNKSNHHGTYKWYVDAEKCFRFWAKNRGACTNCIRVCPFNKSDTRFHRFVKWHVKNLPQFDSFYLWMDKICGYGRMAKNGVFWD